MKHYLWLALGIIASDAAAETRAVFLEDIQGTRIEIATLNFDAEGSYSLEMAEAPFSDHFLSMRPFKCLEGP